MKYTITYRKDGELYRVKLDGHTIEGTIEKFREKETFRNVRIVSISEYIEPAKSSYSDFNSIFGSFNGIFK